MNTSDSDKNSCTVRFHGTLNDFLPADLRNKPFYHHFFLNPSVKDLIESLNVPHVEVDDIWINGEICDFFRKISNGDIIEVFHGNYEIREDGKNDSQINTPPIHLLPRLPEDIAFILDVHLGKLARNLRLLGFDCAYRNDFNDDEIISISEKTNRILLTRDIQMLKNFRVKYGYFLRSTDHRQQTEEILNRFQIKEKIRLMSRCSVCNGHIHEVPKDKIISQLEPETERFFNEFFQCDVCGKVYWKGSHYERMQGLIAQIAKL